MVRHSDGRFRSFACGSVLLVLGAVQLACGAPPVPSVSSARVVTRAPRLDLGRIARDVHDRTNAERTRQQLPLLAWNAALAPLAQVHSDDMAARGFFGHQAPDGADVNARARRLGLTCRLQEGRNVYTGFSENLFMLGTYRGYHTYTEGARTWREYDYRAQDDFAPEIVAGWMGSAGHRANLLSRVQRSAAVALAVAADGRVYATQVFC